MNNFTGGEVDTFRLGGRDDTGLLQRSLAKMRGFMPIPEGPAVRCPGLEYIDTLANNARLMELPITGATNYLLELYNLALKVRRVSNDTYVTFGFGDIGHPWSGAEIDEIQYDRDARAIYFAHQNHPPKVLAYIGVDTFDVDAQDDVKTIPVTTNTGETLPFQGVGNYPRAVAIWGSRLCHAGSVTEPNAFWASKTFDFYNHEYYEEVDYTYKQLSDEQTWTDPTQPETEDVTVSEDVQKAESALKFVPAGGKNNEIQTLVSTGTELLVASTETEYIIPPGVTANNPQMPARTHFGASAVQGLPGDNAMLFVQGSGTRVREYLYQSADQGFQSPELTFQNSKLTAAGIKTVHYQREPYPYFWFVMTDGTLVGMLYEKSAGAMGWFKYETGPFSVESMAIIPGQGEDTVYVVLSKGGGYYLTKMAQIIPTDEEDLGAYRHLINYLEGTSSAGGVLTGLTHLEGETVRVFVTGTHSGSRDLGEFTVASGQITGLPVSTDVAVGVEMDGYLTTHRSYKGEMSGERSNVFFTRLQLGPTGAGMTEADGFQEDIELDDDPHLWGTVETAVKGAWDRDFQFSIHAVGAHPMRILAINPEEEAT